MRKALVLLLLMLLPLRADALALPYEEDTVLSVLEMTPPQRTLANFLYTPVFNMETRIDLPKGTAYDDVSAAMGCLMQDYPELFHLGKDYVIGYYRDAPETAVWLEPAYRMSAEEAAQARAVLYAQAYLIADAAADAEALHDQLCTLIRYGGDTELRHTAVGALLEGTATCEGYAQALTLLYRMKGIPCGVIIGNATDNAGRTDRHAWNLLRMNGYTLLDLTWNDQNGISLNTRWYYGLSTRQMAADHLPDAGQNIPPCGEQDNWHAQRGLVIATEAELLSALQMFSREGQINLRFADSALYARAAHDTHALLDDFNRACPQDAF